MAAALAEGVGQELAVGEIYRNEDGLGNVGLVEINLFEECGEEGGGGEGAVRCTFCVRCGGIAQAGRRRLRMRLDDLSSSQFGVVSCEFGFGAAIGCDFAARDVDLEGRSQD